MAILAIAAGFGLWVWVLADFLGASDAVKGCQVSGLTGALTCHFSTAWFEAGLPGVAASIDQAIHVEWGILIDPLTVVLLGLVTFVALGVQLYSLDYMKGDARFGWYFAWQALFVAAMLTLVLADNFLLLYIAWELVGLCSYLLIGFWFENPGPREAAKKAFVVTRIGDVGLLVGILLLWVNVGSFSMSDALKPPNYPSNQEAWAAALPRRRRCCSCLERWGNRRSFRFTCGCRMLWRGPLR